MFPGRVRVMVVMIFLLTGGREGILGTWVTVSHWHGVQVSIQ